MKSHLKRLAINGDNIQSRKPADSWNGYSKREYLQIRRFFIHVTSKQDNKTSMMQ